MNKTPKLRFKEFSGDWEIKKLGELGEFKKTYSFSRSLEGEGNYKHIHYGDIHMNYKGIISKDKLIPSIDIPSDDNYEFIQDRDIIFADASEDRKDLGKVAVVRNIEGNILSGLHTLCFRPKEDLNSEFFLSHSLNKEYLKFMYTRGNGAKVLGISKSNLSEYKFLAPSKEEQEKIASFFSLIDDKISLQGEKVEALKDYKKGMMQKIFSRELRFKDDDGRDYPEWEEKKLGDIAECLDNKRKPLNSTERVEMKGSIPYYGANGVVDFVNDYIFDEDIILLAEDGGNFDDFATKPIAQFVTGKSWVNNHAHVLRAKYNAEFLFYSLVHKDIRKYINGTSRAKLNKSDMLDIVVNVPKSLKEQKKIADTLGAIYSKIEKEQEKLDYLNGYKKGLLQQMFV